MFDDVTLARFWSNIDVRGADECWPWTGPHNPSGRGNFNFDGKHIAATHIALTLAGRPRPSPQHMACHTCDNPPCTNQAHLWWGTNSENILDAVKKGRHQWARKTHCAKGHPYSGDNLVVRTGKQKGRHCRTCMRIAHRAHNAKRSQKRREQR